MSLAKPQTDISDRPRVRPGTRESDDADTTADLPTQDDLPCSDGEPLESERHRLGMELLINSLEPWLRRRYQDTGQGGYVSGDMFLYFSPEQLKNRHFRGPDVMVVLGVEPGERKSWVTWQEGKGPDLVIELLSDSTRTTDKLVKPLVYRDEVGVREYYWFDPFNPDDFAGFSFARGERASPASEDESENPPEDRSAGCGLEPDLEPDDNGRITSELLGLQLGMWRGRHVGVDAVWLRWYTPEGELLLTEEAERAEEQARRADDEARRADDESRRAEEQARRADDESRRAEEQARRADDESRRADDEARRADDESRRADDEARRADDESRRAAKLADKLRELGLDPGQIV